MCAVLRLAAPCQHKHFYPPQPAGYSSLVAAHVVQRSVLGGLYARADELVARNFCRQAVEGHPKGISTEGAIVLYPQKCGALRNIDKGSHPENIDRHPLWVFVRTELQAPCSASQSRVL